MHSEKQQRENFPHCISHEKSSILNFFRREFVILSSLAPQISYPINIFRSSTRSFSELLCFLLSWWVILCLFPSSSLSLSLWSRSLLRSHSSCEFYNFNIQLIAEWQKPSNHANLSRARENDSRSLQTYLCHPCLSAVPLSVRPRFQSCLPDLLPPYCRGLFPMRPPTIQLQSVQCLASRHLSKSFSRKQR